MAQKKSLSQPEVLEISKIALQNVESNPIIKPLMEDLGYNSAKISEGRSILKTPEPNLTKVNSWTTTNQKHIRFLKKNVWQ